MIAEIIGLIEGGADGAGLGVQVLKHLSRTRLLLHLVDLMPVDGSDPASNCRTIELELSKYSEGIAEKTRWLVFTKTDLLTVDEAERRMADYALEVGASIYFSISSVTSKGTDKLMRKV